METLYNNYMAQKASLSASARQAREALILAREKEAQQFQESLFGQEAPDAETARADPAIQKRVFAAIEAYAGQAGADLVLDSSNNPTLLYASPSAEHTQQVIDL